MSTAHTNTSGKSSVDTNPASSQAEFTRIWNAIEELRAKQKKKERGARGFAKKWGPFVTFLIAALSLPTTIAAVVGLINRAETKINIDQNRPKTLQIAFIAENKSVSKSNLCVHFTNSIVTDLQQASGATTVSKTFANPTCF